MELKSAPENVLVDGAHAYCLQNQPVLAVVETDFPALPVSPSKPPASKKSKQSRTTEGESATILQQLSTLFNTRFDTMKTDISKMTKDMTTKIENLTKTLNIACAELRDVKASLKQVDDRVGLMEKKVSMMEGRLTELENYSRRWNLRLYGVAEKKNQNVREEVISICQAVLPGERKDKFLHAIDTVHRLGQLKNDASKPRGIILQFTSRIFRDAVWKAAKKSSFLQSNNMRFAEDLSPSTRERRKLLWPLVAKAREEGKTAYYIGDRAFANGTELLPMA